jgi:glycosyltransferase involved in cell wall biosynthesis
MKFYFYSPIHFEKWDWRSPDDPGIGGSETTVVETARRLALRGHDVTVYAPLRDGCPTAQPGGARWLPLDRADFSRPGVWVLSRCPSALDNFPAEHPNQKTWLVCQDVFYPKKIVEGLTEERAAKLDLCLALCQAQQQYLLENNPELKDKMRLSSNGFKTDLARRIENGEVRCQVCGLRTTEPPGDYDACECAEPKPPVRDPYRIIYTSSPDRGLPTLLKIFKRAREAEPRLTLAIAYGWDNIKKCEGRYWENVRRECEELMKQPGITWLGRLGQEALYKEFLASGLWVYPTTFTETSCISCMEAQALGAVPVTNPLWALADNVRHGTFLIGDPANEPLVRAQYVGEILRLTRDLDLQEHIRSEMMPWARVQFNWERVVDHYEAWAADYRECAGFVVQYAFQLRHAKGRVLNVGCGTDYPGFGRRGGVNVDALTHDPNNGMPHAQHVLADARLPLPFDAEFDTVIVGDLLEHLSDDDAVAVLRNAAECMKPDGRLVITCPEDYRTQADQHGDKELAYLAGEIAWHSRPVTRAMIEGWLERASLKVARYEEIDYGFGMGHGFLAEPIEARCPRCGLRTTEPPGDYDACECPPEANAIHPRTEAVTCS